jgi:hypothetical protein
VKPNYVEHDITEALTLANTAVLLLLQHMFFISTEHDDEVQEMHTMLRQYRTDFSGRLQAVKTEQ